MKKLNTFTIIFGLRKVMTRFPFMVLNALVGTIAGLTSLHQPSATSVQIRLLLTTSLGMPLLFTLSQYAAYRCKTSRQHLLLSLAGVVFLLGYFWLLPHNDIDNAPSAVFIRYFSWLFCFHLTVAFLPVLQASDKVFWQYNKSLFLRFLLAWFFSAVLYVGLAIALLLLDYLLDININFKRYTEIWIIMAGIVHPLIFLAGIPEDISMLAEQTLPRGIRIFAQFILLPLVILYLAILYAYSCKIVWLKDWPKGDVGYLVSALGVLGVFTLLLLHPYELLAELKWLKRVRQIVTLAMIPMTALLFGAVYQRVSAYGITELRYYLFVLGAWLLIVSIWFAISQSPRIKFVPITLALLCLATMVGPWSAMEVSFHSQKQRLKTIFNRYASLAKEKIKPNVQLKNVEMSAADTRQVTAILTYMEKTHRLSRLQPLFEHDISKLSACGVMHSVALKCDDTDPEKPTDQTFSHYFNYNFARRNFWQATPQVYMLTLDYVLWNQVNSFELGTTGYKLSSYLTDDDSVLKVYRHEQKVLEVDLHDVIQEIIQKAPPDQKQNWDDEQLAPLAHHIFSWDHGKLEISFEYLVGSQTVENEIKLNGLTARVVVTLLD